MREKFNVKGMSCAACVAHVDKAVRAVDGVLDCQVNLLTNSMEVEYTNHLVVDKINKAVSKAGYKSSLANANSSTTIIDERLEFRKQLIGLFSSIILLIPLFYLSMGHMMDWNIGYFSNHLLVLGITLMFISFVMMVINKKFFINGLKGLIHGAPNMDTLVSLGSGVAFVYSTIILFIMAHYSDIGNSYKVMKYSMNLAFETAGMVPTLISIGKTLEAYSKGKTTSALKSLINMSPKKATIIKDGKEVVVDISSVAVGDIFIVKPGEAIPVDGVIINGASSINEAELTGESVPVNKTIDSKVYTATINIDGTITCKAQVVGGDTSFAKIIKMVEDASASKAPIARIADKVAGVFVPLVMGIATLVFLSWIIFGRSFVENNLENETLLSYSIERAIAVLVISCPCALGLATPVAIMVGNGKSARNGILFKNATALEETSKMNYVVLDKTGTITEGKFEIANVISYIDRQELLHLASSLEANSAHPLAKAIADSCDDKYMVSSFENVPGKGINGIINGKKIYALNLKAAEEIICINDYIKNMVNAESEKGMTTTIFIYDNKVIGLISLRDMVKKDSAKAIKAFKELGLTPIMLTGDNEKVAKAVSSMVGIDHYVSDVLPLEKLSIIEEFKSHGRVMMVGDGINDAPALTKSDIGIAIGAGSDVAIDAASVILVKSSLMDAVKAVRMSRHTMLNIKENLFWAFFYNIIMIPIASGVFSGVGLYKLKPWYGALAMALSSVFVVLNALRLNLFDLDKTSHKKNELYYDISYLDKKEGDENMEKIVINVDGMMCKNCKKHVEEAAKKVEGVKKAVASLEDKNVTISYKDKVDVEAIKASITAAGYEVK